MKLDFMKYQYLYFLISAVFLLPCLYSLITWGLKPSIDFTGGTILELKTDQVDLKSQQDKVNTVLESQLSSIQESGPSSYILRLKQIDREQKDKIITDLSQQLGPVEEVRFETVGPTIGQELIRKTIMAVIIAAGFILFYVAYRFKEKRYGVCAILAMFHDSLILLGIYSLLGHFFGVEIDTLFVTAVLTILSFSVHDTVVVYDRIRESVRLYPRADYYSLVNKAVAETLTRSVNNSMTIIFMLLTLYLLGGETTKWFVFALLIGTISGTYSSTFTAAPLLVLWDKVANKTKK